MKAHMEHLRNLRKKKNIPQLVKGKDEEKASDASNLSSVPHLLLVLK